MKIGFTKLAGACAVACMAAAGTVTAMADQGQQERSAVDSPDTSPTPSVQSGQARRLGELRRDRGADDALPGRWQRGLADNTSAGRRFGANVALSRRAAPGVWLVPGDGFVCVAYVSPADGTLGFSCVTPSQVDEGLLQPASLDKDGAGVVTGVMPDGVSSVTLVDRDGSSRHAAVDRNVYRAAVDADLQDVRWTDAGGVDHVRPMAWIP
jgi:hypothetical protein